MTTKTFAVFYFILAYAFGARLVTKSQMKTFTETETLATYPPPSYWVKQDYINYQRSCYDKGDSVSVANGGNWSLWNPTVNKCLQDMFCSYSSTFQPPSYWSKYDYEKYQWDCFVQGDTKSIQLGYWSAWNSTVNSCQAQYCITTTITQCIECLSQNPNSYWQSSTLTCYQTTSANSNIAFYPNIVKNLNECPFTRPCQSITITQYTDLTTSHILYPYESCRLQVTNAIPWDKNLQSEPTFSILSNPSQVIYYYAPQGDPALYNADWNKGVKQLGLSSNIVVDHIYRHWIQIVNTASTAVTYAITVKMLPFQQLIKTTTTSCVACLSQNSYYYWQSSTNTCYETPSTNNAIQMYPSIIQGIYNCPITLCQVLNISGTYVDKPIQQYIIQPSSACVFQVSNSLIWDPQFQTEPTFNISTSQSQKAFIQQDVLSKWNFALAQSWNGSPVTIRHNAQTLILLVSTSTVSTISVTITINPNPVIYYTKVVPQNLLSLNPAYYIQTDPDTPYVFCIEEIKDVDGILRKVVMIELESDIDSNWNISTPILPTNLDSFDVVMQDYTSYFDAETLNLTTQTGPQQFVPIIIRNIDKDFIEQQMYKVGNSTVELQELKNKVQITIDDINNVALLLQQIQTSLEQVKNTLATSTDIVINEKELYNLDNTTFQSYQTYENAIDITNQAHVFLDAFTDYHHTQKTYDDLFQQIQSLSIFPPNTLQFAVDFQLAVISEENSHLSTVNQKFQDLMTRINKQSDFLQSVQTQLDNNNHKILPRYSYPVRAQQFQWQELHYYKIFDNISAGQQYVNNAAFNWKYFNTQVLLLNGTVITEKKKLLTIESLADYKISQSVSPTQISLVKISKQQALSQIVIVDDIAIAFIVANVIGMVASAAIAVSVAPKPQIGIFGNNDLKNDFYDLRKQSHNQQQNTPWKISSDLPQDEQTLRHACIYCIVNLSTYKLKRTSFEQVQGSSQSQEPPLVIIPNDDVQITGFSSFLHEQQFEQISTYEITDNGKTERYYLTFQIEQGKDPQMVLVAEDNKSDPDTKIVTPSGQIVNQAFWNTLNDTPGQYIFAQTSIKNNNQVINAQSSLRSTLIARQPGFEYGALSQNEDNDLYEIDLGDYQREDPNNNRGEVRDPRRCPQLSNAIDCVKRKCSNKLCLCGIAIGGISYIYFSNNPAQPQPLSQLPVVKKPGLCDYTLSQTLKPENALQLNWYESRGRPKYLMFSNDLNEIGNSAQVEDANNIQIFAPTQDLDLPITKQTKIDQFSFVKLNDPNSFMGFATAYGFGPSDKMLPFTMPAISELDPNNLDETPFPLCSLKQQSNQDQFPDKSVCSYLNQYKEIVNYPKQVETNTNPNHRLYIICGDIDKHVKDLKIRAKLVLEDVINVLNKVIAASSWTGTYKTLGNEDEKLKTQLQVILKYFGHHFVKVKKLKNNFGVWQEAEKNYLEAYKKLLNTRVTRTAEEIDALNKQKENAKLDIKKFLQSLSRTTVDYDIDLEEFRTTELPFILHTLTVLNNEIDLISYTPLRDNEHTAFAINNGPQKVNIYNKFFGSKIYPTSTMINLQDPKVNNDQSQESSQLGTIIHEGIHAMVGQPKTVQRLWGYFDSFKDAYILQTESQTMNEGFLDGLPYQGYGDMEIIGIQDQTIIHDLPKKVISMKRDDVAYGVASLPEIIGYFCEEWYVRYEEKYLKEIYK